MRFHTGHVLGAIALLAPVIAVFVPLGLSPLLAGGALGVLFTERLVEARWPSPPPALTILFALILLWCVTSALWSIDVRLTLGKLPGFVAGVAGGLVALDAARRIASDRRRGAATMLLAGFGLALLLLATERMTHAPIRLFLQPEVSHPIWVWVSFNRGITVMAILVWPAALMMWRRSPWGAVALWAATLAVIATYLSEAAVLAMIAGGVACALVRAWPRAAPAALAAVLAGFILASPVLFGKVLHRDTIAGLEDTLPRSGYHRLLIWNFTADHVFARPFLGWGFEASRRLPGGRAMLDQNEAAMPLHPHNGALQVWLELGLPGALLAAALLGGILLAVRRGAQTPIAGAAMTGAIVSASMIAFLSYGVWQSWWVSALWLCAAFAAMARSEAAEAAPDGDAAPARP